METTSDSALSAALDDCCRRVQRGERLDRCLLDYPVSYRDELARLVRLSERLRGIGRDPSPDFQARIERTLVAAVRQEPTPDLDSVAPPRGSLSPLQRISRALKTGPARRSAAIAALALLVLLGGGAGVVAASEGSLPDSPLYQVKEAREAAEVWLARDDSARVGVYARQLRLRAIELGWAVAAEKPQPVVAALAARFSNTLDHSVEQAIRAERAGNPRPAARARVLLREMQRRLDLLAAQAPADLQPPLLRLRAHLQEEEQQLPRREPTRIPRGATRGT